MDVQIRKGSPADLGGALELVRELARFENEPAEVEVTVAEMENWLNNEKMFDFFVLVKNDTIIGLALYYYKYSTWKGKCLFLEDIIVTEKERKNGYGKLLFNKVVEVAKHEKVRRMEWQVLDWNKQAIGFYKKYSTQFNDEWVNCKLVYDQIQST
ncbi:MAG: GNAT family N-acetyltransferase [Bacteroidota bacterium]